MRNEDVVKAFLHKMPLHTINLHSTGNKLFSYDTCIAEWTDNDILIGNATKYSSTTSKHMYYIKSYVDEWTTKDVPRGTMSLINYVNKLVT